MSGKTLSLYYYLGLRLAPGVPTLFQKDCRFVWQFDAAGVTIIKANSCHSLSDGAWALVDFNSDVHISANVLFSGVSRNFIVHAASPQRNRWK